jgi:caffeoyl-CoA O-methyltransferase
MHRIPDRVGAVMASLEARDRADRVDGTPRSRRLRAISPEVGPFLLTLALGCRARSIVEVGTSAGYSTLWLAVAAGQTGGRVITFEIDPAKVELAHSTFTDAGVEDLVELRPIDGALGLIAMADAADLVFLDAEKEDYVRLLEPAIGALRPGGLLVADNLTSHESELADFREAALGDPRLGGLVVPIGRGELVAVRRQDAVPAQDEEPSRDDEPSRDPAARHERQAGGQASRPTPSPSTACSGPPGLIFGYGAIREGAIEPGIRRLAGIMATHRQAGSGGGRG